MKTLQIFLSFLVFLPTLGLSAEKYLTKKLKLNYKTKSTTIHIHYPEPKQALANKVAEIAKNDFERIHKSFDYIPRSSTHIVINESARVSNGSATPFPRNMIFLNDYPPHKFSTLSNSDDWEKILVIHEYVHILTLEMTHGIRNFFRFFLGSTMKWSGSMPRWLAEGVATWAESEFTDQGRLNHPWIKSQTKRILERKDNCHSRFCLDGPRYYPYGSYAYWAGGFYLKYLEEQKKGTVKCLMYRYSKNFPLFINYRIKKCFGKGFNESFHDFRKKFVKENKTVCPLENKRECKILYKKYRNINWFKGYIDNSEVSVVVVSPNNNAQPYGGRDGEKVIIYDKKKKKHRVKYVDYVIEKIYQVKPSNKIVFSYQRTNLEDRDSPSREYLVYSKSFKRKKSEKAIKFKGQCDELIEVRDKLFFCKRYTKYSNWELVQYSGAKDKKGKVLHSFDQLKNVDVNELTREKISYAHRHDFNSEKKVASQELGKVKDFKPQDNKDSGYSFFKYLLPQHLFPGFIIFPDGLTYLMANTSLSDPRSRFTLNLGLNYVLGIEASQNISTPITGYSTLGIQLSDKFRLSGFYTKAFEQTGINDDLNIIESFGGGMNYSWSIGDVSINNGLSFAKTNERDTFLQFLVGQPYRRKITSYLTSLALGHSTKSVNSKYRRFSLASTFAHKTNKSFDPFYSSNTSLSLLFKWNKSLTHVLTGRYSRLFKNSNKSPVFRDGVIYGGGINSAFEGVGFQHPNYLIGSGNIFGNELISARTELDYELLKIFEGVDFIATYLKTISIFIGGDYINSRNLLVDFDTNFRPIFEFYPQILSGYGGLRTKFNFLYFFPLEVDFFAAYSNHPVYSSNTGWLVKSSLSF